MLLFGAVSSQGYAQGSFGSDRAGTQGFQFTKITVDARSAAMGNSNMADAMDGSSLYWNPALASKIGSSFASISHTDYVVETSQEYFSYIHKYKDFAFGGSVQYFGSGDIKETTETQPLGTGRVFTTSHLAAGLTASHKITDLFSYGVSIKYYRVGIEEITYQTTGLDFGFSYDVGETGLRFAVGINNFGLDASPSGKTIRNTPDGEIEEEAQSDLSLPTRFTIGAALDVIEEENSKLILTGQITNPSDNAEQLNVGAEYIFMNQFFFRGGYEFGIEERKLPSIGGGVKLPFGGRSVSADYAYTNYERLGSIHRISLSFSL